MTYLIVLMTLLVVLAGVISYTGDVLGTIVGKRRLTLFGARPKRSGQIIGVLAGILIMLVTLVTLALAFSNARRALFEFQSVSEQNAQLSLQQRSLLQQVSGLEEQIEVQTQDLEAARLDLTTAVEERDEAQSEFNTLLQQQDSLASEIDALDIEVKYLETDLVSAQTDFETAQAALTEAQATLETAQTEREQALADAETANAEVLEAQEAVAELETQVTDASLQLETVQQDLDASQQELEATQSELETIQTELNVKQSELEDTRLALDEATKARDEAVRARDEVQAQVAGLEASILDLQAQTDELKVQQQALSEENTKLEGLNTELESINATLLAQVSGQNAELQLLNEQVDTLNNRLAEQANALELARTQAQSVNSRNLTYTVNQVVHTGIISAQELPAIRAQLGELLAVANDKAVQTRAGDIIVEPETIETVVQEALQTSGADVITLRSRENQYVSEPLSVTVEVAENKMLVEEGQLVVTQQIHLGSPEFQEQRDSVRSDLSKLFISANSSLLSKGLADGVYPVTAETSLEIEGFTNQLLRLSGPVVVGLTASDDIYSGGPAKLEFIILN